MNYHTLEASEKDHKIHVVFHIPVPDEDNEVGWNLRLCLKYYQPFISSIIPYLATLAPTEVTALQNGELYEHSEVMGVCATLTNSEKIALVDARYAQLIMEIQNKLRKQLKYYGFGKNI